MKNASQMLAIVAVLTGCGAGGTGVTREVNLQHPSGQSQDQVRAAVADICAGSTTITYVSGPVATGQPGISRSTYVCES